ncbi:MAG: PqqD family protein [Desulfurococcus sp.]|nr:PqqD family protein [Desulfurococcus sp.]
MSSENNSNEINATYNALKDSKPMRNGELIGEEDERFYVALGEEVYELSPLAYYVWAMCDGEHTVGELAESISVNVGVELKEVIAPLVATLSQLHDAGLINYN